MSGAANPTFMQLAKQQAKRALEHWTPLTVTLGLVAAGIGILSLYLYTNSIGRTDLFLGAIEAKSALTVWLLLVVLVVATYLLLLAIITCPFGLAVSLFNVPPEQQGEAALWLVLPYLTGGSVLLATLFGMLGAQSADVIFLVGLAAPSLAYIGLQFVPRFRAIVDAALTNSKSTSRLEFQLIQGAAVALGSVVAALSPIILITNTYAGEDTPQAVRDVIFITLLTMLLCLAPVVLFYTARLHLFWRLSIVFLTLPLPLFVCLAVTPGAAAGITYIAAAKLDVRQNHAARFLLDQDIQLTDMDNRQWRTRLNTTKRVEVSAFQLFSFGDVLLLCPVDLLGLSRHDLPRYTSYCISTRASKVTRKPQRFASETRPTRDLQLTRQWPRLASLSWRLSCLRPLGRDLLISKTPRCHIGVTEFNPMVKAPSGNQSVPALAKERVAHGGR